MILNRGEQMLFALLRSSLHNVQPEREAFEGTEEQDWKMCFNTASRQGVLALAWEGVLQLEQRLHPPKGLKFQWGISVEKYEQKHRRYCEVAQELQRFYKEKGIVAVQLKGVGFSANYNMPAHREGGDIDIYTYSADEKAMSHREANALSDKLIQQLGIEVDHSHSYKHSNFYFKGIPIENHRFFLNVETYPKFLGSLNEMLKESLNPVEVSFYEGKYRILVPSPQFNMLFISCHAFQHYGSGIALHHLYDWAALLKRNILVIPDEVKETNFLRALAAFTHLANKYLGTEQDISFLPQDYTPLADEMLEEMLYPKFGSVVPHSNPLAVIFYKFRRVLRSAKLSDDVLGASPARRFLSSVVAHIKAPDMILNRGEK
ncbi:MAG: nucleotidyltransferase family protein [Bacteroidales bacterium]|nr:nucleotidyltransferase family protein [Bacteroidales bacterium]MBQ3521534.1 nucleotidyltransferase family protein [Bacteroidales bacterium]